MAAISTLVDGFQDNNRNTALWTTGWDQVAAAGATVAETGQHLDVTLLAATGGDNYNAFISVNAYDWTGDFCYVRGVTMPTAGGGGAEGHFAASLDANNSIRILVGNGSIRGRKVVAGTSTDWFSATYVAATHAWWRLSESGGNISLYTAPSTASDPPISGDWVFQAGVANPFAVTALKAVLGGGTWASETAPGHAIFDGFNGATTSTAGDTGGGGSTSARLLLMGMF